jgi:hypothetical protein
LLAWPLAAARRFGFVYDNSCDLTLDQILLDLTPTREPVFYDLFLQTGSSTMYPVPVKVSVWGRSGVTVALPRSTAKSLLAD